MNAERARCLVRLVEVEKRTFQEIGATFGVTPIRASQMYATAAIIRRTPWVAPRNTAFSVGSVLEGMSLEPNR